MCELSTVRDVVTPWIRAFIGRNCLIDEMLDGLQIVARDSDNLEYYLTRALTSLPALSIRMYSLAYLLGFLRHSKNGGDIQ